MITFPPAYLLQIPQLNAPLSSLKGIGPKRSEIFAEKGLCSLLDLLYFLPIRYEDRRTATAIGELAQGKSYLVKGVVSEGREERTFRRGRGLFRIVVEDEGAGLELVWFHYARPHVERFAQKGTRITAYGRANRHKGRWQMLHPDVMMEDAEMKGKGYGLHPVYSALKGISNQTLRSAVKQAMKMCMPHLVDGIPNEVRQKAGVPRLCHALEAIHFPKDSESVQLLNRHKAPAQRRLLFDRFFHVMINVLHGKHTRGHEAGPVLPFSKGLLERIEAGLPFSFTDAQRGAVKDLAKDMASGTRMNRLLQGDVGCGKTAVAVAAASIAVNSGWQAAVMAPTQVLANQHFAYFCQFQESLGVRPVLLTGSLPRNERSKAYKDISAGRYNVVIGTHALVQRGVTFKKLGLAVIDEQHRFGVRQRTLLQDKGASPHVLVMTATPIPRTLSLILYADCDISVIRSLPHGHAPVTTHLVTGAEKRRVFETVASRLAGGEQAMVICPVIEAFEEDDLKDAVKMHADLTRLLSPSYAVGLVHGRLPSAEKEQVMRRFVAGEISVLVGTTVVEVGIHAPGVTVMVIEHPERFGLAQLHQLRGRVGRGGRGGHCFLMATKGAGEPGSARLGIMARCSDGFEIAERDLELRGQGELTGTRQSGAGEVDLASVLEEPELLYAAKRGAEMVLESDPLLSSPGHRLLKEVLKGPHV